MIVAASIDFQRLTDTFERLKKKSLLLRTESIAERKKRIKGFEVFLMNNRNRIADAISNDFKKPKIESDVSELYPVLTEIRHTLAHLDEWTKPQKIDAPLTYLGTRSEVRFE